MVVVLNNSKALRGFFCTCRSDGLNITSVARTAGSALTAQTAPDARKSSLSNATSAVKPGDNFYPTA